MSTKRQSLARPSHIASEEWTLRRTICRVGRLMRRYGYIDGTSGNISARLDAHHVLMTPSGLAKGFMRPDQIIRVTLDGVPVGPFTDASRALKPTSETPMHLECYRQRPDVGGVVHAHPPTAVALTIAGVTLEQPVVPEIVVLMGVIPTMPYATPATDEDREAIQEHIPHYDALMLSHHGSLTVGPDVWTAYLRLETLEHYARILHKTLQLGTPCRLTSAQIDKLLGIRQQIGLMREGDEARFRARLAALGV